MTAILADRMLEGLARRLRLMGYDCKLAPAWARSGLDVLEYARRTGRPLITTAPGRIGEAARLKESARSVETPSSAPPTLATESTHASASAASRLPPPEVLQVPLGDWAAQARLVAQRWPIDVARLAFTRCSRDNTLLKDIPFEEAADQLPPRVRDSRPEPLRRCPACERLYWPGTHVARIRRTLDALLTQP